MKNKLLFMIGLCYALLSGFLTPLTGQSGSHILSELHDMLDPLDMTEVTSHVLYDRGLDMYHWQYYDGSVPSDSAAFSAASWSWIYTQASTSFLDGYSTLPASSGYMEHMLDPPGANTITMASMWLDYHYLRPDAIDLNLLTLNPIDSTLHDVPARTQSPYIRDTVFMVAPLTRTVEAGTVQIVFASDFRMGNIGTPDTIAVDVGAGWQVAAPDVPLSISLYGSGERVFSVRFTDTNGRHWYSKCKIKINNSLPLPLGSRGMGYSEMPDFSYTAIPGIKTLDVFYGNDCSKILKPFIFIEGYNPSELEDFTYEEMQRRINLLEYEMNDVITPTGNTMWQDLYDSGYDAIYVDFEDGAGDVLANGLVVRAAIEWINAQKASNGSVEKNLVMGASMGGLCGYYALGTMEADEVDHEVVKFITYDSPLRGANIPLGLQTFFKAFGEIVIPDGLFGSKLLSEENASLALAKQLLNSPAPKNMLSVHAWNGTSGFSTWSQDFYNTLHSVSISNAEVIHISNGSGLGEGQQMDCDLEIMDIADITEYADSEKPWKGSFRINYAKVYPTKDFNSSATLTEFSYRIRKWIIGWQWSTSRFYGYNGPSLDCGPGGVTDFGISSIIGEAIGGIDFEESFPQVNRAAFCFVPTPSSQNLASISNYNMSFPLGSCVSTSANSCVQATNNNYILPYSGLPAHNQNHAVLTSDNATYLLGNYYRPEIPQSITDFSFNIGVSDLPSLPDLNFLNFEGTSNVINRSVLIEQTGQLLINRSGRIARTSILENPENNLDHTLEVNLAKGCSTPEILVTNGGELIIGEAQSGWLNKANLILNEDTKLIIEDGGQVFVKDQSKIVVKEDAILQVKEGGLLEPVNGAVIHVQDGGVMIIEEGGLVDARWGGGIDIEEGGEMIVKAGATIRLTAEYSYVKIQEGGKMTIEDGAIVQLWDAPNPDGLGRIEVRGELVVEGDFDLSGNGFFDFYDTHTLTLAGGKLNLDGYGKTVRLIRLNNGTKLDLESANINIKNARIDYHSNTWIESNNGSMVFMEDVHLKSLGGSNTGLMMHNYRRVRLENVDVTGFDLGVLAYENDGTFPVIHTYFKECIFKNNSTGLVIENVKQAYVVQSNFEGIGEGLLFSRVEQMVVSNSEFRDLQTAIYVLEGRNRLRITGSRIETCTYGIRSDFEGTEFNLIATHGTVFENNKTAILISEGGFGTAGDYGLVLFDCVKLINNDIGIEGRDLLLQIDAYTNSHSVTNFRSNTFKCNPGQLLFKLCFDLRNVSTSNPILARGNFWGFTMPFTYEPWYTQRAFCASSSASGMIDYSSHISTEPISCPLGDDQVDPEHTRMLCSIPSGSSTTIDVRTVYKSFYKSWAEDIDNEYYDSEGDWYDILSEVNYIDASSTTVSSDCKHQLDVMSTFRKGTLLLRRAADEETMPTALRTYPNPVTNQLSCELPKGKWDIHITDMNGREVLFFRHQEGEVELDCRSLPAGMYLMKGTSGTEKGDIQSQIIKFVKQ